MLNEKVYVEQISRLEAAYMYTINEIAIKTWKVELEKENIKDSDLVKGVDYILTNPGKFTMRPHLGNLLEWCGKVRTVRWGQEEAKKKSDKIASYNDVHPATDHGKRALSLIKLIIKGEHEKDGKMIKITTREKVDFMLKMEEFYSGHGWQREAMALRKHYGLT